MSVNQHIAVQRNAFSTAVAAAKVCDGAVSASLGERISHADAYQSAKGQLLFALIPSIQFHELVYQWTANNPKATVGTGGAIVPAGVPDGLAYPTTVHEYLSVAPENTATKDSDGDTKTDAADKVPPGQTWLIKKESSPDNVRLVSAGMRLSCINAADSNNGWFEAIRVTPNWEIKQWYAPGSTADDQKVLLPQYAHFENAIMSDNNWANHPSYVTGRLRDIGRHNFYLQPTNRRRFKKWPQNPNFNSCNDFSELGIMDTDFDIVLVRVKSTASATDTLQTSIHVHVTKNWETVYDGHNAISRFMTSTLSSEGAVKYADKQMTRDPKASMIRSASSYAYK